MNSLPMLNFGYIEFKIYSFGKYCIKNFLVLQEIVTINSAEINCLHRKALESSIRVEYISIAQVNRIIICIGSVDKFNTYISGL